MKDRVLNLFDLLKALTFICLLVFITAKPVVEVIFHFDELRHGLFELVAEESSKEKLVIESESGNEGQEFYAANLIDPDDIYKKNNSFLNFQRRFTNFYPETPFHPPKNFTTS